MVCLCVMCKPDWDVAFQNSSYDGRVAVQLKKKKKKKSS